MKNRIRNVIGITIMLTAIVFSVIQLNTAVAKADPVCPDQPLSGCFCSLYDQAIDSGNGKLYCYYHCTCYGPGGPGSGDFFEIEHTEEYQ